MTLEQLGYELQKGNLQHLYVCVGEDGVRRKQALTMLSERICPGDMAAWSYQEVDGSRQPGSVILAMANTPSFMGGLRLLTVLNYETMPAAEQQALIEGLPAADSVVVLLAASLDKRTKAAQALLTKATLIEAAEPKPEDLAPWLRDQARALGLSMSVQTAQTLVGIAGSDTRFLMQELAKFAAYLGGSGTVTQELVLELAALGEAEAEAFAVFRLTDALVEKNTPVALRRLHDLLQTGEPALRLLTMIARQYRQLLLGKAWANDGVTATARALKMKTYPVEKMFAQAGRLSTAEIEESLKLIIEADMALKSGGDTVGTLSMLIVKLCSRKTAQ
ncbi:MAG TPA: DNA polymerase III subunit delta [Firmicutes bacterium]|nr:DNA polymerase III subunit delta [Bacillota bacterium]